MTLTALDNLVRIGQLKAEPRNDSEVRRMLALARVRLADARLTSLSPQGRFTSAYSAAHAAALAAARVGGIHANNTYRADFIYENLTVQNNIIHGTLKAGVKELCFLGSTCI